MMERKDDMNFIPIGTGPYRVSEMLLEDGRDQA